MNALLLSNFGEQFLNTTPEQKNGLLAASILRVWALRVAAIPGLKRFRSSCPAVQKGRRTCIQVPLIAVSLSLRPGLRRVV